MPSNIPQIHRPYGYYWKILFIYILYILIKGGFCMNILCNKVELIEAVGNVQRAVSTKASLPALEGILLRLMG